jgi:AraC-like DNA-binding protein
MISHFATSPLGTPLDLGRIGSSRTAMTAPIVRYTNAPMDVHPNAGEGRALARLALVQLKHTARFGVPQSELLREAGITEAQLSDPDSRIPLAAIARLWRATTARLSDPLLGLRFGADARVRDLGLVGYTMAYSRNVESALRRLSRYSRIMSDALVVHIDGGREASWVRLDVQPALRAYRPAADARLAAALAMCREITGAPIAPLSVQFPYKQPPDTHAYEEFFRAPVEFGALATAFLLDAQDLARPVLAGDESLTTYLEQLAADVLTTLRNERTARDAVRRVLSSELSEGVPDLEAVARALGMSARTLQRRLRAEGTSFAAVLGDLRHELAQPLLRDGGLGVSEVAFLMGYEDTRSFQRSFQRRTGLSPRAYRRLHR